MRINRVDLSTAEDRLTSLPQLAEVLGSNWLAKEYRKAPKHWSLITGWIADENNEFWPWLENLSEALEVIRREADANSWQTIAKKVRTHYNRDNFKGTLSEIAICVFLATNNIPFELETVLVSDGQKNVDISAYIIESNPVHLEVQWLSPSASSEKSARVASAYDQMHIFDLDYEKRRILGKVSNKTEKFTYENITVVALDCTLVPELGSNGIGEAVEEVWTNEYDVDTKIQEDIDAIRHKVDSVIWWELTPNKGLLPEKRGCCINPNSLHRQTEALIRFIDLWLA